MWYNIPTNQDAGSTSLTTFRFTGKAPRATKTTMEKKIWERAAPTVTGTSSVEAQSVVSTTTLSSPKTVPSNENMNCLYGNAKKTPTKSYPTSRP